MGFKDFLKESPVGVVGRTTASDADVHIERTEVGKEFARMVKLLGGKTIAQRLLSMLDSSGKYAPQPKDNIPFHMKIDGQAAIPPLFESTLQDEYQVYFQNILKKYNVKSPAEMDKATMKKFFDEVSDGWECNIGKK